MWPIDLKWNLLVITSPDGFISIMVLSGELWWMLQSPLLRRPSRRPLRQSCKVQRRWYLISTKPTQGQRRKKKNHIMHNWFQALVPAPLCRGSSEFPVLPSQHGKSRIAGSPTRQATEKAWINPGLPNAHHAQPSSQVLSRGSFPLALLLDISAQFLHQDEETNGAWKHLRAPVMQGSQARMNGQGVLCDTQAYPHAENAWVGKEGMGLLKSLGHPASLAERGLEKTRDRPAKAQVSRLCPQVCPTLWLQVPVQVWVDEDRPGLFPGGASFRSLLLVSWSEFLLVMKICLELEAKERVN